MGWFTLGNRETNLSTVVQLDFNLGSETRVRAELSTRFRRKLFHDFSASPNVLESFDSAPPSNEKKNDVSVTLRLGGPFRGLPNPHSRHRTVVLRSQES